MNTKFYLMKVRDTNHVADFYDLCTRQVRDFVGNLRPTFPMHCNGLNSIRVTQTGLLRTCHRLCCKHLDMSRWFVSTTFMIYVHHFPCREVSLKVGVMEFGLMQEMLLCNCCSGRFLQLPSGRITYLCSSLCWGDGNFAPAFLTGE